MISNNLIGLIESSIRRDPKLFTSCGHIDWKSIFQLANQQGVTAIAWSAVCQLAASGALAPDQLPDRALKLQCALSVENIERRYRKQAGLAQKLAEIYDKNGIKTIVLKGLAISGYYPVPEHRECGDLDCFLVKADTQRGDAIAINADGRPVSCYDEGNKVAKEAGAEVKVGFYKHSHINYKGLMVENHAFCTAIRGSRNRKALERHLQHLLATKPNTPIEGTHLLRPCADFNALFLTAHSFGHFLTEGIKLRHILDWALLLRAEQDNIDWGSFYEWCDKMRYTKFVDAITAIATEYLGLVVTNPQIRTHSNMRDKVLEDVLYGELSIHNTKASKFQKRLMIIKARMLGNWKYRELCNTSAFVDLLQTITAFFIERKPKI